MPNPSFSEYDAAYTTQLLLTCCLRVLSEARGRDQRITRTNTLRLSSQDWTMTPEQWAGSKGTPQLRNAMQASITSLVTGAAYEKSEAKRS